MFNVKAKVLSETKGRVRFGCPQLHTEDGEAFAKKFLKIEGVKSVKVNPNTGTLLMTYEPKEFNDAEFSKAFNKIIEKQAKQNIEAMKHFRYSPKARPESKPVGETRKSPLLHRLRTVENRGMAISGVGLLAGILLKRATLHSAAGWVFIAAAIAHSIRYRRTIW